MHVPFRLIPEDSTERIRRKRRNQRSVKHAVNEAALVVAHRVICGHATRARDARRQPECDGRAADGADD
jgi:hypothetical protein